MNVQIQSLIEIQKIDLVIDKLEEEKIRVPREIEEIKKMLTEERKSIEENKKSTTHLKVEFKNMEIEIGSKEEQIKKHLAELNIIKSNEAYKALLTEIEKIKREKEQIEDDMLNIMQEIEDSGQSYKDNEKLLKTRENESLQRVQFLEEEVKKVNEQLMTMNQEKQSLTDKIEPMVLEQYNRIRRKKEVAIVQIESGEYCGGCRMILPAYIVNEAKRNKNIVTCENCARIVYLPIESLS